MHSSLHLRLSMSNPAYVLPAGQSPLGKGKAGIFPVFCRPLPGQLHCAHVQFSVLHTKNRGEYPLFSNRILPVKPARTGKRAACKTVFTVSVRRFCAHVHKSANRENQLLWQEKSDVLSVHFFPCCAWDWSHLVRLCTCAIFRKQGLFLFEKPSSRDPLPALFFTQSILYRVMYFPCKKGKNSH